MSKGAGGLEEVRGGELKCYIHSYIHTDIHTYIPSDEAGSRVAFAAKNILCVSTLISEGYGMLKMGFDALLVCQEI